MITVILPVSFSSPMAYAVLMSDTVSVSSGHHMSSEHDMSQHDCCDEGDMNMEYSTPSSCDDESSFCQHCAQHCAGKIGLTSVLNIIENTALSQNYSMSELSLWQRTERLIRPPKLTIV